GKGGPEGPPLRVRRRTLSDPPPASDLPARLGAPSAAAAAAESAAAAARPGHLGTRLVDREAPAAEAVIVELRHSLLRTFVSRHLHEGESARAAGLTIANDVHRVDGTRFAEQRLEVRLVGFVGEIADVQLPTHITDSNTRRKPGP